VRAIQEDSTLAAAYDGLGLLLFKQRQYEEAVRALEKAVSLDPLRTRAYFNLGNTYSRLGELEKGRQMLEVAARLSAQDRKIDMLKDSIQRHPDDAFLYYSLGVVYGQRGQWEPARLKYEQALARDSSLAAAYHNLANIYLRERHLDRAEALFLQAVAADSSYALAHNSLGHLYLLQRDYAAALDAYRRALRHAPESREIRQNVEITRRYLETEQKP